MNFGSKSKIFDKSERRVKIKVASCSFESLLEYGKKKESKKQKKWSKTLRKKITQTPPAKVDTDAARSAKLGGLVIGD